MGRKMRKKLFQLVFIGTSLLGILIVLKSNTGRDVHMSSFISKLKRKQVRFDQSIIRELMKNGEFDQFERERVDRDDLKEECPIPYLRNAVNPEATQNVSCARVKPVPGSCKIAEDLFLRQPPAKCNEAERVVICQIVFLLRIDSPQSQGNSFAVKCNKDVCRSPISLGLFSESEGDIKWRVVNKTEMLESILSHALREDHSGFCLLKCLLAKYAEEFIKETETLEAEGKVFEYELWYPEYFGKQLLILPPSATKLNSSRRSQDKDLINVNLIFVDSVSRNHFYRSMPNTLQLFNTWNKNLNQPDLQPLVLDFSLMQGIKSRTFESLETLFSGKIDLQEKPFGVLEMPPRPLSTKVLLKGFRELGYNALWLEDLCFMWEWGISKDLLVHDKHMNEKDTWMKLRKALHHAGIDDLGPTPVNCEILSTNGVNDHFHGPDAVCYNGQYQHEYFLQYLQYYQQEMLTKNVPFFSFFETNVGHEDTGVRIQSFDSHFANYLKFISAKENVLTVVFSDHGNSYGAFLDRSMEGKIELYHPFLFIIIPPLLQRLLGRKKMTSLISNQRKLVSLLDLHYTLKDLTTYNASALSHGEKDFLTSFLVNQDGLFSDVPSNRSCTHMPRLMPNLCICKGFENTEKSNPYFVLMALFAIGQLNNRISVQYREHHRGRRAENRGSCTYLVPSAVENVKVSFEKDSTVITKMDIHIKEIFLNQSEVFFVAVKSWPLLGYMELMSYERMTSYGHFARCADKGVNLNLCVCSTKTVEIQAASDVHRQVFRPSIAEGPNMDPPLKTDLDIERVDNSDNCLFIFTLKNKSGVTFDLANICKGKSFQVELILLRKNMLVSYHGNSTFYMVYPGDVTSVVSAVQNNVKLKFKWQMLIKAADKRTI